MPSRETAGRSQGHTVRDIAYSAADAEKQALAYINNIEIAVSGRRLGVSQWQDRYKDEVASIRAAHHPRLLVAILGATGTGKSTLLNAVLGYDILPTSGMTACTAVVTEISHNKRDTFEAEIEFMNAEEWQKEITTLLEDLREGDDTEQSDQLEGSSRTFAAELRDDPAGIARAMVRAAYPDIPIGTLSGMDVDSVLKQSPFINQLLGTTARIDTQTPSEFASLLAQYVDSREQCTDKQLAYWALIRGIKIRCPSTALASGLTLVDLPGVADSNAARSRIAGEYVQMCDHFWIIAPITRAVNDKTAQELLGRAFRHQIRLDGKLDPKAFTFIATKCDDISSAETVRDLGLHADPEYLQILQGLQSHKDEVAKWKGQKRSAKIASDDIRKSLRDAEAQLKKYKRAIQEPRSAAFVKRKAPHTSEAGVGNCGDKRPRYEPALAVPMESFRLNEPPSIGEPSSIGESSSSSIGESSSSSIGEPSSSSIGEPSSVDEPMGPPDMLGPQRSLEADLAQHQNRIDSLQLSLNALTQQSEQAHLKMVEAEAQSRSSRRRIFAFCSLKRSEYSRRRIQADFKTGLHELGVNANGDLPVFTVSARDYALLSDGEESACFENVDQTCVPALREWCHALIMPIREKATHNLLVRLRAFLQSFTAFLEGTPGISEKDRELLQEQCESFMGDCSATDFSGRAFREVKAKQHTTGMTWRLINNFVDVNKNCVCDLQDMFEEHLGDKCDEGTARASQHAVRISDEFASSIAWQSYRATMRRDGSWTRDLNTELLAPFSGHIATSWCKLFEKDLFTKLGNDVINAVEENNAWLLEVVPPYLQERTKRMAETCMAEVSATLGGTILPTVNRAIQDHQKSVSRKLAPFVRAKLIDGYRLAKQEQGRGCIKRQKAIMHDHVQQKKDMAFNGTKEVLTNGLAEATASIEEHIADDLAGLAMTVEKNFAGLWDGPVSGDEQIAARLEVLTLLHDVSGQIGLLIAAQERRDTAQAAGTTA